jgi:hypothetical protein
MKLCPYCGKTLVKDALACKHCGEWLEDISDYLRMRGSVYAHTDSMVIPISDSKHISNLQKEKKVSCVFCEFPKVLDEKEKSEKKYTCPECGKTNLVNGNHISDIMKNVPAGWGWLLLTAYFIFSIQKHIFTLDDELQMGITFFLSLLVLLSVYFSVRYYILKERFEKKRNLGKIYNASIISGVVSIIAVIAFAFALFFAYPYTGLQSDKKITNNRIYYYKTKISEISEKQKNINEIISKPIVDKNELAKNANLLDEYIKLNNEEKKYADSIYKVLEDSEYYTEKTENKKKIKDASLLVNKIIVYKVMSARNLKHFYQTGDKNALKAVEELNSEINKLNKEYSSKYQDLFAED